MFNLLIKYVGMLVTIACISSSALAQSSGQTPNGQGVPHYGMYCVNAQGNDVVCNFGNNSGGNSGGGGPVTAVVGAFVDGAIVSLGSLGDSAWSGTGNGSLIAINKAADLALQNINAAVRVNDTNSSASNPRLQTHDDTIANAQAGSGVNVKFLTPPTVADSNSAAFLGVITLTPGTATTAGRSIGYICTTAGNITLTLTNGSTITLPIQTAGGQFQTLPFAVTNVSLGSGTTGTFWNLL